MVNLMEAAAARAMGLDPPRREARVRRRILSTSGNLVIAEHALSWEDGVEEMELDTKVVVNKGAADEVVHILKRRARWFEVELYLSDALRLDRMVEPMTDEDFRAVKRHLERTIREWVEGVPPQEPAKPFGEYPGSWEASVRHVLGRDAHAVLEVVDLESGDDEEDKPAARKTAPKGKKSKGGDNQEEGADTSA